MSEQIYGWHFVGSKLRDGRPVPKDGEWLHHDGPVVLCKSGLHGSRRPWHALQYAPGAILCRVEFGCVKSEDDDKLVARSRRIIARADVTEVLRYFARMQAASVVHLWDAPDVVLDYLMTGDASLRAAARTAAQAAARTAARAAAQAVAWEAAWAAAQAVAWEATWAAAQAAARAAARTAARAAARTAAQAAAWEAAWAAAQAAAGREFDALIDEQFGVYDE